GCKTVDHLLSDRGLRYPDRSLPVRAILMASLPSRLQLHCQLLWFCRPPGLERLHPAGPSCSAAARPPPVPAGGRACHCTALPVQAEDPHAVCPPRRRGAMRADRALPHASSCCGLPRTGGKPVLLTTGRSGGLNFDLCDYDRKSTTAPEACLLRPL